MNFSTKVKKKKKYLQLNKFCRNQLEQHIIKIYDFHSAEARDAVAVHRG